MAPALGERGATVARNAFYLVLGQVATTVLAILMSAALGRSLGASDFGLYFLVVSMAAFAAVLLEWGQLLFVVREVAREPGRAPSLLGTALVLRLAGAAAVSGPTWLAARALGYDSKTCAYAVAFIWSSLPFALSQACGLIFRAHDRMGLDATVSVLNKAAIVTLTVLALQLRTGIPGVMVAQAIAGFLAFAVAVRFYRRLRAGRLSASWKTAREMLAGGAPIVAMTAVVAIQPYLDAIVLSKLVPAAPVGWYGAARTIMGTLLAPSMILASAFYPRLSRAAREPGALRDELRAALRPMLWLGALGGIGTFLFADVATGLVYGARGFAPAGAILRIFGLGLFAIFIDVLLGHALTAVGRTVGFAVTKAVSVVVSTGLDIVLIPHFQRHGGNGGIGVIVAFITSEVVVLAGSIYLLPRGSIGRSIAADVVRALATALATGALILLLPPLSPLLAIPLCVVAFTAVSLGLGLAKREDVELLRGALVRERSR
ncbi:MAG TPA: flippase [Polyangiaceae bacterium]|nr:flippase [Polyangiaceae bacterium]